MLKRCIEEEEVLMTSEPIKSTKNNESSGPGERKLDPEDIKLQEMGEFEDNWEDEIEEEDIIMDNSENSEQEDGDDNMEEEEEEKELVKAYLPGQAMEQGEELEIDSSAYDMYHAMNVEWPCLSFDVLKDNLGSNRSTFPCSLYILAGTQADQPGNNKLLAMKVSKLHKMKKEYNSDNDESDDEEFIDEDPLLEYKAIKHDGGVNRVRIMPHNEVHIAATWSDTGKVNIWDLTTTVKSLNNAQLKFDANMKPVYINNRHRSEGYALDWSSLTSGRLLSGDCENKIYLTELNSSGVWNTDPQAFIGHSSSVEDLQWSPTENNVFASCSVDQTVKIWDARMKKKEALSVHAHKSDVNVISWNRKVSYLIASGSDDGDFSVWDLRNFKNSKPAASFKWHNSAVTSLEWHPDEESVLAVSGADDQVTIWDFSVELDVEEMNDPDAPEVPPQLLFIHQGQTDIKEVHWHPQIPGTLMSTAKTGFNFFKTISI